MKNTEIDQEKKLNNIRKTGETLLKICTPTFIGSVLSPFDFEGPIIEIASGTIMITGILMKNISEIKLSRIKKKGV